MDLDALKAQHGTIYKLDTDEGPVVFRRPTRLEYRRYRQEKQDEATAYLAEETLARSVVVYPAEFDALLDKLPVLSSVVAGRAIQAGGGGSTEAKKL